MIPVTLNLHRKRGCVVLSPLNFRKQKMGHTSPRAIQWCSRHIAIKPGGWCNFLKISSSKEDGVPIGGERTPTGGWSIFMDNKENVYDTSNG